MTEQDIILELKADDLALIERAAQLWGWSVEAFISKASEEQALAVLRDTS